MKLGDLIAVRPAIEKIASGQHNFSAAIEFAKFTRKILMTIQEFEIKRSELFNKYGVKKTEDNTIVVPPESEASFKKEMKEILERNIEIEPLDVSTLEMKVAPADLINCLELFK